MARECRRAVHILLVALLVSACAGTAQPAPRPPAPAPRIVVLGSSTAAGAGLADPETSWVRLYAAFLAREVPGSSVTNLAVGGYSTFHIQATGTANPAGRPEVDPAHNVTAALTLHPDAVIINLPSNDAATGVPVKDSLANISAVVAQLRNAHVLVWVTTSQPRTLPSEQTQLLLQYRDHIRQQYGSFALDFFTPLASADATPARAFNVGDGIHPNAEGHRLLFEQVKAANLPAVIASAR